MTDNALGQDISGRLAVVTGGAQGIGRSIAEALAEAGAKVVIADLNPETGERAAAEVGAEFVRIDVTSSASVWCYSTESERQWWGGLWADRVVASNFAGHAIDRGFADAAQLAALSDGWREWAADPDAWFAVVNGEILCRR